MHLKLRTILLPALAGLVLAPLSGAELGAPAAPLNVARWLKGTPVNLAEAKGRHIVVVDFWATWAPPCLTSIPHLTRLQKQFKDRDVLIVGITDESASVVEAWVRKMGDQMDYAVAVDNNRATSKAYLEAFGKTGLPTAFVVDKAGHVVWVGHPTEGLGETLEAVVAGTYSVAQTKRRTEALRLVTTFFDQAKSGQVSEAQLADLAARIESLDRELGGLYPGQRFTAAEMLQQARTGRLLQRYEQAVMSNPTPDELDRLEREIRPQLPPGVDLTAIRDRVLGMRHMQDYLLAAYAGDRQEADSLAEKTLAALKNQPQQLDQLAWFLLTEEGIQYRDRAFALRVARAAHDASQGQIESIVDTYARALFDNGRVSEAIEQQKKAVALATDDQVRRQLERTLKDYEAKARP